MERVTIHTSHIDGIVLSTVFESFQDAVSFTLELFGSDAGVEIQSQQGGTVYVCEASQSFCFLQTVDFVKKR